MESREGALQGAGLRTLQSAGLRTYSPGDSDTIWTDGSHLDCGRVGAACVWRTPGGWTGRRFHLGKNKEVFDAEVYAIFQALSIINQRQERVHRYTVFVDSTSAIDRVRSDSIGPGQSFAIAAIETCTKIISRSNEVAIRWVPAHQGAPGNEMADEYAKAAAEGGQPDSDVPDEYRWETSLSHMTRMATEGRSRTAAQWIADRLGNPRRKYRPPPGRGLRRRLLRKTPKSVAGRYYQLLPGHAAIGPYLKDRIGRATDDKCWWYGGGKQQTRHHLFTECRAWLPQIRKLWKEIGKAHAWEHPRAPSGKWLWKEKSTEAVLVFLKSTRVGCISTRRKLPEGRGEFVRGGWRGRRRGRRRAGPAGSVASFGSPCWGMRG